MHDATVLVLALGIAGMAAVLGERLASSIRLPAPVLFLAAGLAIASVRDPEGQGLLGFDELARIGTFALIFILFHGGFDSGWKRTRGSLGPILGLGLAGTLATSALLAAGCHYMFGLPVQVAVLVGVALAPTDPAAVFSVLAGQRLRGRTPVILEGESGANDPVGIALMIGAVEYYKGSGSLGQVGIDFALQMVIGVAVGVALGLLIGRRLAVTGISDSAMHNLSGLAGALVVFGVASTLHGSGFLAVFVAGLCVGSFPVQRRRAAAEVLGTAAMLSEVTMFAALGLTITVGALVDHAAVGLGVFALLTVVIRPLVVALTLWSARLANGERVFVAWGGLKGAVPILLASFPVLEQLEGSGTVYAIVFVAVATSMLLQGSTLPLLARRVGLVESAPID